MEMFFPEVQNIFFVDTEWFCFTGSWQLVKVTNGEDRDAPKRFLAAFDLLKPPVDVSKKIL